MRALWLLFASALLVPALARQASGLRQAKGVPALQPADVYDADYPVDHASLTPMELRYKAQADYAKAVAKLKKELAEAEAARKEMERLLKEFEAAERAASDAEAEAERRLREKNAASDKAVDADTHVKMEKAESATASAAAKAAQADVDAAKKAHADATAGKAAAKQKVEELKQQQEKLQAEIKKIEDESAAAGGHLGEADKMSQSQADGVTHQSNDLSNATARATQAEADAARAKQEVDALKKELAKAEASAKGQNTDALKDQIAKEQKEFDAAEERYTKENNDVKAARQRVEEAKRELAKWETTQSAGNRMYTPTVAALTFVIAMWSA